MLGGEESREWRIEFPLFLGAQDGVLIETGSRQVSLSSLWHLWNKNLDLHLGVPDCWSGVHLSVSNVYRLGFVGNKPRQREKYKKCTGE